MTNKIPYAGKERSSWPTGKDNRLAIKRGRNNAARLTRGRPSRNGVRPISIWFETAIFKEIVSLARARKMSFGEMARNLVKLGLQSRDGVQR